MEKSKGLGDTIKKITGFLGIPTCQECQERADWLNEKFPYAKETPTESDLERICEILNESPIKSNMKELNRLSAHIGGPYIDSCFCTPSQRIAYKRDFENWWNSQEGPANQI